MDFNHISGPTPTLSGIDQRPGTFPTLPEALDYAAEGETGLNFYSVRGELTQSLPYRILRIEAIALAQKLIAMGLKRRDPVALIAETQPDFVRIFFACQYAGLVPVPLPLPFAFGGRETYVAHIGRLIVEAKATALFAPKALIGWLSPFAETEGLVVCSTVADLADAPDADAELPVIVPDDIAYLQFSSGSTRFPIGVVIKQRALMANASAMLSHGLEIRPRRPCRVLAALVPRHGARRLPAGPRGGPGDRRSPRHPGFRAAPAAMVVADIQQRRHDLVQPELRL